MVIASRPVWRCRALKTHYACKFWSVCDAPPAQVVSILIRVEFCVGVCTCGYSHFLGIQSGARPSSWNAVPTVLARDARDMEARQVSGKAAVCADVALGIQHSRMMPTVHFFSHS